MRILGIMKFLLLILSAVLSGADILSDLSLISELLQPTDQVNGPATKTSNLGFDFPTDLPTKLPAPLPSLKIQCQGRGCGARHLTTGKKIALGVAIPLGILFAIVVVCFGRKYGRMQARKAQAESETAGGDGGIGGRSEGRRYGVWVRDEGKGT